MLTEELKQNQKIYDDYLDMEFGQFLSEEITEFLAKYYFRAELIGFDGKMPERENPERPIIYISNHSGMAFPWDGMIMSTLFFQRENYTFDKAFRPVVAPILSQSLLMNPYMIPHLWRRVGAIDATFKNLETMMHYQGGNIMIYPEGVPGIGKGFNNKYKLQRFSSSFVYNSIKYKTNVIGIVTVNGEYLNPYSYSVKWIDRLVKKVGVPFFPMGFLTPFLLLVPWIFYMAYPAKLKFVRCRALKPYEMTDKSIEELSKEDLRAIAEECRKQMQEDLDKAIEIHGKDPFEWKEHFQILKKNWRLFPFTVPLGWPLLFAEFENKYKHFQKTGEKKSLDLGFGSVLRILFQNPITICYYIPILGWIPLLIKGFRKKF